MTDVAQNPTLINVATPRPGVTVQALPVQVAVRLVDTTQVQVGAPERIVIQQPQPGIPVVSVAGAQGPAGVPGIAGTSAPGLPGTEGEDGADGAPGPAGPIGPVGLTGPAGPSVTGTDGEDGLDSTIPGPQGNVGPQGAPGLSIPGTDGDDGLDGPPGAQGNPGLTGPTGLSIPGTDGDDGLDGPPGAQGNPGLTGPTGLSIPGTDGDDGLDGPPGAKGDPGFIGPPGITIPGTDGDDGLDSMVPGPAGTPGSPGAPGAPGSTGPAGAAGAPGIMGEDGDEGGGTLNAGTTPYSVSGTGFVHITGGLRDLAAKAVDLSSADATGILAAARFPALTGDVTTVAGALATTIVAAAVTLAKMENRATQTFIGRNTAGTGVPEELSIATAKTMLNLSGTNSGDQTITLTGDVTGSGAGSFAATIANAAVTNAKMANMATQTYKGRHSAGTGVPEDVTAANLATDLKAATPQTNLMGPNFLTTAAIPAANTDVTVAHSLGRLPFWYVVLLRCVTAELGYVAGDEISLSGVNDDDGARNSTTWMNTSVLGFRTINGANTQFVIANRTIAGGSQITTANWILVFRAW